MNIQIAFSEIQEIIEKKTGKEISLSMVNKNTIRASYTLSVKVPMLGLIDKNVNLDVTINKIDGTDINMTYDCGLGMSLIIGGALKLLKEDPRLNFIEVGDSKQLRLKLGEIENIRNVFEKVAVQSIGVVETGIETVCKLKEIL